MNENVRAIRLVRMARLGRNEVLLLAMSTAAVVPFLF